MNEYELEKIERFKISISPHDTRKLLEEWSLYSEAHNGFDNYLAYTLMKERVSQNKIISAHENNSQKQVDYYESLELGLKSQKQLIQDLLYSIKETNQHVIELLEYSEIDAEVAHVWANAEHGIYKARAILESEAVKQFKESK